MTKENARPENIQPGASQSDEKTENQNSLTDKNSDLFTGTLRFQQTKEQKTMAEAAKNYPVPKSPQEAEAEFKRIKEALIGPTPEWCLPPVNPRAKASIPLLDDSKLFEDCNFEDCTTPHVE